MNRRSITVWANVVNLRREYSVFLKTSANEASKCVQQNANAGETQVKGYEQMPGPKAVPLIGNSWRFLPVIGWLFCYFTFRNTLKL